MIVKKWKTFSNKYNFNLIIKPTLQFLIDDYQGKYYHDRSFYPFFRRKFNLLLKPDGKPVGDKWSFDKENRKSLPKNIVIPDKPKINKSKYVKEAINYINKHFPDNYGSLDFFIWPITHKQAENWLIKFIKERFDKFGDYEDAIKDDDPFLFHSQLSVPLNVGLLTDTYVLETVLKYQNKIPLPSFEGFIRQLSWRNYVMIVYTKEWKEMIKTNFFKGKGKVPKAFWDGTTGLPPVDDVIKQVNNYGYAHHIQRLMILGNILVLCDYEPISIMEWFLQFVSMDAYLWVMIGNIAMLGVFGEVMMTRPYVSSSNYILKMSNYKSKDGLIQIDGIDYSWSEIWDALFWSFVNKNKNYMKKNYATANYVNILDKKTNIKKMLDLKNKYLQKLNGS